MDVNLRERNIKAIIKLEDRIAKCKRCPALLCCTSKPATGKGDLVPEAVIVFECEGERTTDIDWIVEVRNTVQKYLKVDTVYHTFLVRCQSKACPLADAIPCRVNNALLDAHNNCRMTNRRCVGIPIKPTDEAILNCLNYVIEELHIFQPQYVILFGGRVSEFVLKAYGIMDTIQDRLVYHHEGTTFISVLDEQSCRPEALKALAPLLEIGYQENTAD
ncbi:MAG: hypothetical protein ABRQ24_00340 [Syntrophomonadaceae bacterium]